MPASSPKASPLAPRQTNWSLIAAIALGVALLAAYANSFQVPFVFDDASSITENTTLRSWKTAFFPPSNSGITASGRPLLNASLALNYALGGENVVGYHVVNLLIHYLAALALFGVVRRSFLLPSLREKFGSKSAPLALAITAIWALHPLQTESVTYIVQRAESLVGLLYLLTLYCFLRSVDSPTQRRWQIATFAACLLGMSAKEVMVSAPAAVLLLDRTLVAGSFSAAWRLRRRLYLALASTWILLAVCIISTGNRGGTVANAEVMTWWQYAFTQSYAILLYLRLMFWPSPLIFDYGHEIADSLRQVNWEAAILAALIGASLWAFWKKPKLGMLAALFFALLAPSSSIVPVVTQTIAEHRNYLPLATVTTAVVAVLYSMAGPRLLAILFTLPMILGFVTYQRNKDYKTVETLYADTIRKLPVNSRPWVGLAEEYEKRGDGNRAEYAMSKAYEVRPQVDIAASYADMLVANNKREQAFEIYKGITEANTSNFKDAFRVFNNYGVLLRQKGQHEEAALSFQKSLKLKPDFLDARTNLAIALILLKQPDMAISVVQEGLASKPQAPELHLCLGMSLAAAERHHEAIRSFSESLRLLPNQADAHRQIAKSLLATGDILAAIEHYRTVVKLSPGDAKDHYLLANALLQNAEFPAAIESYEKSLGLNGSDPEIYNELGIAYVHVRNFDQARKQFEAALKLDPNQERARANLNRLMNARP